MTETIIIPLLNKRVTLLQGPPILLSNDALIEKLTDDEFSAFFRMAPEEIKGTLDLNNTKCIKIRSASFDKNAIKLHRTKAVFTLNIFTEKHPLVTSWAGHVTGENKITVKTIVNFESLAAFNKISANSFKFTTETKRNTIIQFFQVVEKSLKANPSISFTMEKYNSALLRDDFFDRLLDAAICFETMMPGNTELVYRLSQNIAFIVGSNATERLEIFDNMKKLYDVRSKIVHGDLQSKGTDAKIESVKDNWITFEKYLKSAVTYFLLFLSTNKKEDWEGHLKEIIIGTKNKII